MVVDKPGRSKGEPGGSGSVSPIAFYLDPSSGAPTYVQLVQQVERALRLGYLRSGDQLPRIKDVTGSLAINPDTVLKAYRELEHRGIAAGRPGKGTFIVAAPSVVGVRELAALEASLTAWLDEAAAAGLDQDGMTALFIKVVRAFPHGGADSGQARERGFPGPGAVA